MWRKDAKFEAESCLQGQLWNQTEVILCLCTHHTFSSQAFFGYSLKCFANSHCMLENFLKYLRDTAMNQRHFNIYAAQKGDLLQFVLWRAFSNLSYKLHHKWASVADLSTRLIQPYIYVLVMCRVYCLYWPASGFPQHRGTSI